MIARLLKASLWNDRRRKAFAVVNIALATALATALLNMTLDVGDKMNREMRGFGANLVLVPRSDELPLEIGGVDYNPLAHRDGISLESLPRLKEIFWRHNIVAFAPFLEERGRAKGIEISIVGTWFERPYPVMGDDQFRTGLAQVHPWWQVSGRWPHDAANAREALVGAEMARRLGVGPGDVLPVTALENGEEVTLTVQGILRTGAGEDDRIFVPLEVAERFGRRDGLVDRVAVSALTKPDDELARKARHDREALTTRDFDLWYCSPYVDSVAYQIEEVIPGVKAKPIRQITESEGVVVRKIQFLMAIVTVAALLGSGLGVFSLMSTMIMSRKKEIGLAKALGASNGLVMLLFFGEISLAGLIGALLGFFLGVIVCEVMSLQLFGAWTSVKLGVIPVVMSLAVVVSVAGSLLPARLIMRVEPSLTLAGE